VGCDKGNPRLDSVAGIQLWRRERQQLNLSEVAQQEGIPSRGPRGESLCGANRSARFSINRTIKSARPPPPRLLISHSGNQSGRTFQVRRTWRVRRPLPALINPYVTQSANQSIDFAGRLTIDWPELRGPAPPRGQMVDIAKRSFDPRTFGL
jgi:hypothetical protein